MHIACLDFQNATSTSFMYQGFSDIARELGHDVESTTHDGSSDGIVQAYAKAGQLIKEADAIFIPNGGIFKCLDPLHPAHFSQIQKRVKGGARILATPFINQPELDNWNWFLAPFDLIVTTHRIHQSIFRRQPNESQDAIIKLLNDSFRDPRLFVGVEEVVLRQPVEIWYGGESYPVLCFTENEMPVNTTTDFLLIPEENRKNPWEAIPQEWNGRERACMALWYGPNYGAILASVGPPFFDPYVKENKQLVANVIRFLSENSNPPLSPSQRCSAIEKNLVTFVFSIIKDASKENWWTEMVPERTRVKCAERHEQEQCRYPKEAYVDLIDLKMILEKAWPLFEPHFRAEGREGGKKESLKWMNDVNEIRKMIAHPSKREVAGYNFTQEDVNLLSHCDDLVRRLWKRIQTVD